MRAAPGFRFRQPTEICGAVLALLALYSTSGFAAETTVGTAEQVVAKVSTFDLPSAPMAQTLDAIAHMTGQSIVYDGKDIGTRTSQPIKGQYTAKDAVAAAIANTGLNLFQKGSTLVVSTTQTVEVLALRSEAETSFKADRSDTATRSGTDLMDVPGSMTVITSDVLSSQQTTSLIDSLKNVSGVNFSQSPQGTPQFSVRGFSETSQTVNGVSDHAAAETNVSAVDRIEVLKGPQAILAGGDSLGGGINVVMKKPTTEPILDLMLQAGTYMDLTVGLDKAGTVLSDDKRLSYRFIVSGAHADRNSVGYNGREDYFAMPEVRWKDATTDVTFGVSFEKSHQPVPKYTFATNSGEILPAPNMLLGNKADGFDVTERKVWYDLEQKLSPALSLISRIQYSGGEQYLHLYTPFGLNYNQDGTMDGTSYFFPISDKLYSSETSGDHYLRAVFKTADIEHKLSVGVGHSDYNFKQPQGGGGDMIQATLYPATPYAFEPAGSTAANPLSSINYGNSRQLSAYAQDLVSWEALSVLVNLRHTDYSQTARSDYLQYGVYASTPVHAKVTTPGVGVVYRVSDDTSLYASASQGFSPQFGTACGGGGNVAPIRSRNKEVGAKFQFFDNALSLTTSAFQIDQSNSVLYVSSGNCYDVRPAEQTRGLELDLQGQLAKGWKAVFNYTYSRVRDVQEPLTLFPGQPKNKASLWTTYDLPLQQIKGLSVGLGLNASSAQEGTYNSSEEFKIPAQVQIDTSLFYNQPKWHATLGVKNVANRTIYGISTSNAYIPVTGRTVMFTFVRNFE